MSLALGYSSGEDEDPVTLAKDTFGLSSLPSAKKPRVDDAVPQLTTQAAPDVLSEVSVVIYLHRRVLKYPIGST
jgi:pre-mRNA-processing factor 17